MSNEPRWKTGNRCSLVWTTRQSLISYRDLLCSWSDTQIAHNFDYKLSQQHNSYDHCRICTIAATFHGKLHEKIIFHLARHFLLSSSHRRRHFRCSLSSFHRAAFSHRRLVTHQVLQNPQEATHLSPTADADPPFSSKQYLFWRLAEFFPPSHSQFCSPSNDWRGNINVVSSAQLQKLQVSWQAPLTCPRPR